MPQALSDRQRRAVHDLALKARTLLVTEARELLEGVYGLYEDGRIEPPNKLPQVQADPEKEETYRRLVRFLDEEARAGVSRPEAVEKLIKEVAFTHLNRLVAFKMMEARDLIRGTLDKGPDSNAFKFYLADPAHADHLALYEQGEVDAAYRHFLLWQSGQIAQEIRVLFDPDTLVSRLFPRPRALNDLLDMLNDWTLAEVWLADETVGWVYQFFNEEEKAEVFDRLYNDKQKLRAQDIPAATQLFTPYWIVRFLVQNTLGRLWVQMHPDTELRDTELLDYLVPLEGHVPDEPLRPVREITLLDPACGGMHFGLIAFDLFASMYGEELERAGEPGWPETPSVENAEEIPTAILERNLFGIDIDLRAVQLSALALYLKAKSYNPEAMITASNLACADVTPLNGERLGTFVREAQFKRPIYERLMRTLWEKLQDASQLGSLLRLEKELQSLIEEERARYQETPLFAGVDGEFEAEAAEEEFWDVISQQIVQGLNQFAREQAAEGIDQTFFTGEATKGLRLLDLMLRRYDVVVTNPPYSGKRNLNDTVTDYLKAEYEEGKSDLYAAFIIRCAEWLKEAGRLGMITQQSFMFISSYEDLRTGLRQEFAIETMAHTGPHAFPEISGEKVNTTVFALREETDPKTRMNSIGTYLRLVHEDSGEKKRLAFERALADGSNTYHIRQQDFRAVPGEPWVYWFSSEFRSLLEKLPRLGMFMDWRRGTTTAANFRFIRLWWEVGLAAICFHCRSHTQAKHCAQVWFPYMKGGEYKPWYGNQHHVLNWYADGKELQEFPRAAVRNLDRYFDEGLTYSSVTSGGFSARVMPPGFIFDQASNALFPEGRSLHALLGVLNSDFSSFFFRLNPTVNIVKGDFVRIPFPLEVPPEVTSLVTAAVQLQQWGASLQEITYDFTVPPSWDTGVGDLVDAQDSLAELEDRIDQKVYSAYGIDEADRAAIEAELTGGDTAPSGTAAPPMGREELAVRWISYAVGTALGRFQPGVHGALGSAVYRREDFAVGSLPAPDQDEFDELVGSVNRFAYVDEGGGRHVVPPEVESALRNLSVDDGITVLDEGHTRDLPALVSKALRLMLGDDAAREVIAEGAGGDLRQFLSKKYFTDWHFKWYSVSRRKAAVYWPLQSANLSYGLVLFHEKIDETTLYVLQREYLDYKLNGLRQRIGDLTAREEGLRGSARKRGAREVQELNGTLEEIEAFAKTIDRIVREGYEPQPNWIDDGVILRMAPLWELTPIWSSEPKKYWKRLQEGQYDWSHIAMNYWPERVREACRGSKSFAIAHGHPDWHGGG